MFVDSLKIKPDRVCVCVSNPLFEATNVGKTVSIWEVMKLLICILQPSLSRQHLPILSRKCARPVFEKPYFLFFVLFYRRLNIGSAQVKAPIKAKVSGVLFE